MIVIAAVGRKAERMTQVELIQQTGCLADLVFQLLSKLGMLMFSVRMRVADTSPRVGRWCMEAAARVYGESLA